MRWLTGGDHGLTRSGDCAWAMVGSRARASVKRRRHADAATADAPCLVPQAARAAPVPLPCAKHAATLSRANERMQWEAPAERQGADGRHKVPGARAGPVPLLSRPSPPCAAGPQSSSPSRLPDGFGRHVRADAQSRNQNFTRPLFFLAKGIENLFSAWYKIYGFKFKFVPFGNIS